MMNLLLKFVPGGKLLSRKLKSLDPKKPYRTEEQEKAVFYFSDENKQGCFTRMKGCFGKKKPKKAAPKPKKKGCFPKKPAYVSDAEYDALVKSIVQRMGVKSKGLQKLGLDESQIEKTISFGNYVFGVNDVLDGVVSGTGVDALFWKVGDDGRFRSSVYEVTIVFFTQAEIAAYQLTLSSDWEKHEEKTFVYHYKDITALNTKTLQKDVIKDGETVYQTVKNDFLIAVPGDSFSITLSNMPTQKEEDAIQAMRSLLREKKA